MARFSSKVRDHESNRTLKPNLHRWWSKRPLSVLGSSTSSKHPKLISNNDEQGWVLTTLFCSAFENNNKGDA